MSHDEYMFTALALDSYIGAIHERELKSFDTIFKQKENFPKNIKKIYVD